MKSLVLIFFSFLTSISLAFATDQKPDLLIIGRDTILLRSYPLEELGFKVRPFHYGPYDFPGIDCFRGYQAVWKVVGNKLFLAEIIKADETREKIDIVSYFLANEYTPIVINGLIFADWFSMDLRSFPRDYKYWGCVWKPRSKKERASVKFHNGVMTLNRYRGRN